MPISQLATVETKETSFHQKENDMRALLSLALLIARGRGGRT